MEPTNYYTKEDFELFRELIKTILARTNDIDFDELEKKEPELVADLKRQMNEFFRVTMQNDIVPYPEVEEDQK